MTIRQYSMMRMFAAESFTTDSALKLHQTTFGSLCRKRWVRFNSRTQRFELSPSGREMYSFASTPDLYRKHASENFSVYVHIPRLRIVSHKHAA